MHSNTTAANEQRFAQITYHVEELNKKAEFLNVQMQEAAAAKPKQFEMDKGRSTSRVRLPDVKQWPSPS